MLYGDGTTLDKPEGGGAISVQFKDVIYVDLSENKITLDYTHPQKSHNNIVLKLTIQSTDKTQDIEIFRTGYLEPGSKIEELTLPSESKKLFENGGVGQYDAKLVILAYNAETNLKDMVEPEFEVTVVVQE